VLERYSRLTGLQAQTGISARSGESFFQERQDLYRQAASKARSLEQVEVMLFMMFAHWQGIKFAGYVEYDTNYSERDVELKLHNLKMAQAMAPESVTIQAIIERELVGIIGNTEDKKALGIFNERQPVVSELPNPFDETKTEAEEKTEDYGDRSVQQLNNGTYDERVAVAAEYSTVKP
jgi:hypothetical protein